MDNIPVSVPLQSVRFLDQLRFHIGKSDLAYRIEQNRTEQ
jgi:hypothetical protein